MKCNCMLVLLLLSASICCALSLPGELAHYPLTDGEGTQAREALNRFPPAEITGSFWAPRDGFSLIDFGGMKNSRQAQVLLPKGISFEGEFSIAVWLSAYWWKENWGSICYRSDATYGLRNNHSHPGQLHFRVKDKGAERGANLFSSTVLDKNVWYHVVVTFKPGKFMRLYIDGRLDAERTENVPVILDETDKSRFKLGRSGKDECFSGVLYSLHLFDRALEEAEVATLYQAENRFGLAVDEATLFPQQGAVAVRMPGVEVLEGGALRIAAKEGAHLLNSLYSYPAQPAMGYNLLAPTSKGEPNWKPVVHQVSPNQVTVTAEGAYHRLERTVSALEDGRIHVQDRVSNLTKEDLAVVFSHCLFPTQPLTSWYLHGEEGAFSASDGRIPPSNPTGWLSTGQGSLGWVVEDDAWRCHLEALVRKIPGGKVCMRFGSRRLGIPAGQSRQFEFTLYPMSGDYFDFLNRLRRDWQVPVVTLPGPFITMRTAAQRCEVYKALAADPSAMKAYFTRRNARVFTINPWFNYWDGTVFRTREEYKTHVQKVMQTVRAAVPDALFLASLETYAYFLGEEDFTTPAPPDFDWENVTPGTLQRVLESPWRDSATITHTGNISLYPDSKVEGKRRSALRLMVHPLRGNHFYHLRLDEFRFLLEEVGLDGIYQDMFGFSSPSSILHDRWDGFSVTVNPDGTIDTKFAHLGPLTAPGRADWLRDILRRGKLALTNFGAPTTREMQTIPYLNFCEAAGNGIGRQNLESIPPDSSGCAMNQLGTPLAYGPHRAEECNATRLMSRVRAYLRYGCLYIHTSVRNSFPETGENGGSYDFINHCYPITPVELHRGWVKGRERIVSCVSFATHWDLDRQPKVLRFDANGRSVPVDAAATVKGKPGAWDITVKLDDWKEFLTLE